MGQIMLSAGGDVDLSTHVGHKVEVTGTIAGGHSGMSGGAASTTGTGGTTTASGATTTASGATTTAGSGAGATTTAQGQGGGRGMRTMHVTSLKMISADCGS
jgi:hypothetical protein